MANKRHKPEEIVRKLRQVDVLVGQPRLLPLQLLLPQKPLAPAARGFRPRGELPVCGHSGPRKSAERKPPFAAVMSDKRDADQAANWKTRLIASR